LTAEPYFSSGCEAHEKLPRFWCGVGLIRRWPKNLINEQTSIPGKMFVYSKAQLRYEVKAEKLLAPKLEKL
jgi:hypothetical protein